MRLISWLLAMVFSALLLVGCSKVDKKDSGQDSGTSTVSDLDADTDSDSDTDSDVDTDTDSDSDTDSDGDTDVDSDTDTDSDTDSDTHTDCDQPEEVQQPGTVLCWRRCPLGQTWDVASSSCTNEATEMESCDASGETTFSCTPDNLGTNICKMTFGEGYRLPTRNGFIDLLGDCDGDVLGGSWGECNSCSESADCAAMFGPDERWYWSSSMYNDYDLWYADFRMGGVNQLDKPASNYVRCVRSLP